MKPRLGLIASIVLFLAGETPVSAVTVKQGTFAGTATVGAPLGYPCGSPPGTTDCLSAGVAASTGPWGEPTVAVAPDVAPVSVAFSSTACFQTAGGAFGADGAKRSGVSSCTLTLTGSLWGYCGLATGSGVLTLANLGPLPGGKPVVSFGVTITDIAGSWRIHGTYGDSAFNATAAAVPTSGTCATASATGFTLVGEFTSTNAL